MKDFSAVFNAHPQYIDSLYRSWLSDPASVEDVFLISGGDLRISRRRIQLETELMERLKV